MEGIASRLHMKRQKDMPIPRRTDQRNMCFWVKVEDLVKYRALDSYALYSGLVAVKGFRCEP